MLIAEIIEGFPYVALASVAHAIDQVAARRGGQRDRDRRAWGERPRLLGGSMSAGAFAKQHAGALLSGGARDGPEIQRDYDLPVVAPHVLPGTSLGHTATIAASIPVMVGEAGQARLIVELKSSKQGLAQYGRL